MGFSEVKDILSKTVVMMKLAFLKIKKKEKWYIKETMSKNTSTKIMMVKKSL
jgi:hypothetical protein